MDRFIVFETVFRVIGDVALKSNMDRFIECNNFKSAFEWNL